MPAKRAASTHKASVAKKVRSSADPVQKKIQVVVDALADEDFVIPGPASCREMLIDIAPASLKTPADERHANQTEVISMLQQACEAEREKRQARVDQVQTTVDAASDERAVKVKAKEEAEATLKTGKDETESKKQALWKAEEVVAESKDFLKQFKKTHSKAASELDELLQEQQHVVEVQQDSLKSLKEGSCFENDKDVKKHVGKVASVLKDIDVEVALLKSLPQALGSKPEERGSFDQLAIQQIEENIATFVETLGEKIKAAETKVSEEDAACVASDAVIEVAEEKQQACEKVLAEANEQEVVLTAAVTSARTVVKEHTKEVRQRNNVLVEAQIDLNKVDDVQSAIAFLQDRVAPPPADPKEHAIEVEDAIEIPSPTRGSETAC